MIEFKLPSLGADMDEAQINEWLVKPGDTVTRGQVVAEVETTKSAVEVECWDEGTVRELLVPVGATVPVGTVLATLADPDERSAEVRPSEPEVAAAAPVAWREPEPSATVSIEKPPQVTTVHSVRQPLPSSAAPDPMHRQWISPAARRRARDLDVDLRTIEGTGPAGSIVIDDVVRAASRPVEQPPNVHVDRNAAMRKTIAAAMIRSKRDIPHYYLSDTISLGPMSAWLEARNASRPLSERVLPAVSLLKATAVAARKYPEMNGFWTEGEFEARSGIHLGVAIAIRGGGLIAPAIHDVADKPVDRVMSDLADLVKRARAGNLRSSELSDATLTVTSLGDQGVETVFGVIYPPQVALVGFGSILERPWIENGQIRAMPTVVASLAADHRVSDGRRGALFLAGIRELLQNPDQL